MLKPIPLLQKKRIKQVQLVPRFSDHVFQSQPLGDHRSWEVFTPVQRCQIVVEKLHLRFDLVPPGYPERYQATVGDVSWLSDWECAVIGGASLWTVHEKFDTQVSYLESLGQEALPLLANEHRTLHLTLKTIRQYPLLCRHLSFCRSKDPVSHARLRKCISIRPRVCRVLHPHIQHGARGQVMWLPV